jgi:hypothetical protein
MRGSIGHADIFEPPITNVIKVKSKSNPIQITVHGIDGELIPASIRKYLL